MLCCPWRKFLSLPSAPAQGMTLWRQCLSPSGKAILPHHGRWSLACNCLLLEEISQGSLSYKRANTSGRLLLHLRVCQGHLKTSSGKIFPKRTHWPRVCSHFLGDYYVFFHITNTKSHPRSQLPAYCIRGDWEKQPPKLVRQRIFLHLPKPSRLMVRHTKIWECHINLTLFSLPL